MGQSRRMSLIEQICNVGSGFIVSLMIWICVIQPVWGIQMTMGSNLQIMAIFTLASIARGYVWRRLFNSNRRAK